MGCILHEIKKQIQKDEAEGNEVLIVKTPTGDNFFYDFWTKRKNERGDEWEKK